jgi:ribosomal protein S18 acetylase RimI-like enzyme
MTPFLPYEIRQLRPDETAALFVVHAAIEDADAGQMLAWVQEMEERLEYGGRAWVAARGRRLAGYAEADPVPGLPGVYDLTGGIVPARRQQGLGTMLLRHVQGAAAGMGIRQLSCRVPGLEDEVARYLLQRGFYVEHEECLLILQDLSQLPPVTAELRAGLGTFPAEEAVAHFLRVYDDSFSGMAWSQPYTEDEVASALARPEDLLFAVNDGRPAGVIWHEMVSYGVGRVEPLGVIRGHRGRGLGRLLLVAALDGLRRRGAREVQIGVWRDNHPAMNLYTSLGFAEVDNWYFLAHDVAV